MELDFSDQILSSRPGPKGSAQTPAKPEEKKKGSSKNEPGSAGTKPDAKKTAEKVLEKKDEKSAVAAITFSEKVTTALKNKVKEHNEKHSKKVTLGQLKKVYRRGAGAFSSSHRPGKTRGQWAMARVNMFLKMMRGGKVKDSYRKADQDVAKASTDAEVRNLLVDEFYDQDFSSAEFAMAKIDLLAAGITTTEIYEYSQAHDWEIESEAEKKTLNKPFRLPKGSKKKFGVYVKNEKGNVVKVTFGDPNMEIRRDDKDARKNFRSRHQCDTNPGPKYKARYWSCRMWEAGKSVTQVTKGEELLELDPTLANVEVLEEDQY